MNYQDARAYLENVAKTGITLGLENMQNLMNELGNPQDELKFIHIAGTNGKGSTLAFTSTILEYAGFTVGRYISPAVVSYLERIQINRMNIPEKDFCLHLERIKSAINTLIESGLTHPSVFEIETALGFLYFKAQKCDFVVMETGMGGVSDATNIVNTTIASVFTSVSRDHMEYLGQTLEELTLVKAGIIKPRSNVVFGKIDPTASAIISYVGKKLGNKIYFADPNDLTFLNSETIFSQSFSYCGHEDLTIKLLGKHQIYNAILAIETMLVLKHQGYKISDEAIKKGLFETEWFGRITILKQDFPIVLADGAHNVESANALALTLEKLFPRKKIVGIMGVFKDKEVDEIITEIKNVFSKIHTISLPDKNRSLEASVLSDKLNSVGLVSQTAETLEDAISAAMKNADVVVAFGSLSHLSEVKKIVTGE